MTKDKKRQIEQKALDVLSDEIESFVIEDRNGENITLHLYPLQLGRLAMISKRLIDLDLVFDEETSNVVKQMWKICADRPQQVAEIIAIATLRTKQEIDERLKDRTELILWSPTMNTTAYYNLLNAIVDQSYYEDFMNAIRLVRTLRVTVSPMTTAEWMATTGGAVSGEE